MTRSSVFLYNKRDVRRRENIRGTVELLYIK